jgi:hypothetical protein
MGLSDRYDEYNDHRTGGKAYTESHPGFEKDIMSSGNEFNSHYHEFYVDVSARLHSLFLGSPIPMNTMVDRNTKGSILSPYEPGGVHTNHVDEND